MSELKLKFPAKSKNIFETGKPITDEECINWLKNGSLNPRNNEPIENNIELYRYIAKEVKKRGLCWHPHYEKLSSETGEKTVVSRVNKGNPPSKTSLSQKVSDDKILKNNEKIIKILKDLIEFKSHQLKELPRAMDADTKKKKFGLERGKFAFLKAIQIIKNLDFDITDSKQIKDYAGIGKGIMSRIDEVLKTGKLEELEPFLNELKNSELKELGIIELKKVYGIGEVYANQLYDKFNIKNIKELKQAVSLNKIELTTAQSIGLRYYDDLVERIPREEMDKHNNMLNKVIKNIDKNLDIVIAGSYRRNAVSSGDIDVLMTHSNFKKEKDISKYPFMEKLLSTLLDKKYIVGELSKGDTKFNGICQFDSKSKARRIDIRYISMENFYPALLYFTGSGNFNIEMRKRAKSMGYKLSEYHLYKLEETKNSKTVTETPVLVSSEKEVFEILGMNYLKPEQREMGKG